MNGKPREMPKGQYKRKPFKLWLTTHDERLKHLLDTSEMSYAEIAVDMNVSFPGNGFTRNGVLGRAHRRGWRSRRKSGGQVGFGRPAKMVSPTFGSLNKPKTARIGRPRKNHALLAASVLLREEGDPGSVSGPQRKLSANDPELAERRKGHIPNVIEEWPRTSRPLFETEADTCKWPTSSDIASMEVCGVPATCGAYCDRHGAVAYRVMPTRRRQGRFHKTDMEHTHRLEHALDTADQDVLPIFLIAKESA